MCTATWDFNAKGYDFLFNRDELLSRGSEIEPKLLKIEGVTYLSPIDSDSEGTWIFVNEYGVSVGLLNLFPKNYKHTTPSLTRGLLVQSLAKCKNIEEIRHILNSKDLKYYKPFSLLAFDIEHKNPFIWQWDSKTLRQVKQTNQEIPLTSSSFCSNEVESFRKKLYYTEYKKNMDIPKVNFLIDFHNLYLNEKSAYSIMMSRPDAQTFSFCHISIENKKIKLRYAKKSKTKPKWENIKDYYLELKTTN